jgi:hypothetical protein
MRIASILLEATHEACAAKSMARAEFPGGNGSFRHRILHSFGHFYLLLKRKSARTRRRMNRGSGEARVSGWQLVAGWFLFLSYAVGSPVFALIEARTGLFSARFDYPPEFLYLVSGVQFVCALVLFKRALAPWSVLVLTIISVGAVFSHFRIDSPITSLPAVMYTIIQIWYGYRMHRQHRDSSA